ncbi:MAG: hypothetical protein HY898_04560 [Deltaproteobacteria bacterium]|nr:hypothetical protein [Deltaproteobacteria bacterium]
MPSYHGDVSHPASRLLSIAALGLISAGLIGVACNPPPPPPKTPAPRASASAPAPAPVDLVDARWGRFVSKRFDLSMQLPDGHAWRIDDHKTNWLLAAHPGSSSVLRVRMWREQGIVGRDACEQRARDWTRDIPLAQSSRVLDRHPAPEVPAPGFDTEVITGVSRAQPAATGPAGPAPASASIDGFVMAFGASMKRCFAAVYTTSSTGADGSARLGERLGIATRVIESISFRSELDPDVRTPPAR